MKKVRCSVCGEEIEIIDEATTDCRFVCEDCDYGYGYQDDTDIYMNFSDADPGL